MMPSKFKSKIVTGRAEVQTSSSGCNAATDHHDALIDHLLEAKKLAKKLRFEMTERLIEMALLDMGDQLLGQNTEQPQRDSRHMH